MKIVLIKWSYEILMDSIFHALKKNGHDILQIEITQDTKFETVVTQLEKFNPQFTLTHNMYVFDLWAHAQAFEDYFSKSGRPIATWVWEPPMATGSFQMSYRWMSGPFPKSILFLTVDSGHLQFFSSRSLAAEHLPLGVDSRLTELKFSEEEQRRFNFPIFFAGLPGGRFPGVCQDETMIQSFYIQTMLSEFDRLLSAAPNEAVGPRKEAILESIQPSLELFFSDIYLDADRYEAAKGRLFQQLEAQVSPSLYKLFVAFNGRVDFCYSWYESNLCLIRLQPFGLRVFGGENWKSLLPGYEIETPRLSENDMHAAMASSSISFGLTKHGFHSCVHERPLKILVLGGFALTDYRADFKTMFEDDEISLYRSPDELLDMVKYFLKNEEARKKISAKGRARILKDHLLETRTEQLIQKVKAHFRLAS